MCWLAILALLIEWHSTRPVVGSPQREAIERLNNGIGLCLERSDGGTRELLEHILVGEEDHADWLETQLELIRQIGEAHYLAQQVHD